MVEKILNNTTPYGKIRASHEGSLHSSTLIGQKLTCMLKVFTDFRGVYLKENSDSRVYLCTHKTKI